MDNVVAEIAAEQGWSDETVGRLALEFIEVLVNDSLEGFRARLREVQQMENEAVGDPDIK